jgi:hypothetical protein
MMAHLTPEEKKKGVITCSAGMSLPSLLAYNQEITLKESLSLVRLLAS